MTYMDDLIARLVEFDALRDDDDILTGIVDRIEPEYESDWPVGLHQAVRGALGKIGINRPYKHQYEAIAKSLGGADVVLESPTASGKTLAFTAPMLHALKSDSNSHAMMIYPTKALSFDQRAQIQEVCAPLHIDSWSYDGDTDTEHKKILREKPPHILFTNPEYLNASFLGWREQWNGFLSNLRYIVIDEMHAYRGFFGSNMALLLRRFFLYLQRIGASPQVFLSTATCANPGELASNLTGKRVEVVSARDSFRPKRHFVFVNPRIPNFRYRDILQLRVENAALAVLSENLRTLIFCPTKRFLEDAFSRSRKRAEEQGIDPGRISAFHADIKSDDRQIIQQKIKSGEIGVVFTTNALELGLNIGGLDTIILAGFPPSIMSAWQQIGRAGRGWDKDALVLLYAMNDPIDRFFVSNLNAFLDKPFDELVVDPANEELINNHTPSLISEIDGNLYPWDEHILGSPFYHKAKQPGGKPVKGFKPQHFLSLRGGVGRSFKLKSGNEEIGQISGMRRFREAYIGAIFTFFGRKYRVHSHEEGAVVLTEVDQNLRTEPGFFTSLYPSELFNGFRYGDFHVIYGSLNFSMNFTGYKIVDEISGDNRGTGGAADSYNQYNLHALQIDLSEDALAAAGVGALEHLIRVGAMFVIPADRFDASTFSKTGFEPMSYYYENYSGGIGIAKKLFEVWPIALKKGIEVAKDCSCSNGCQNCIEPAKSYNISNADIDKRLGIELAHRLLAAESNGPDHKLENHQWLPI